MDILLTYFIHFLGIFQPTISSGFAREPIQAKLSDQGSSSSADIFPNQACSENLSRGNSFDNSVGRDRGGSNSGLGRWQAQTAPSDLTGGLSRSNSDEFGANERGMFGRRGVPSAGVFNQSSSSFGMRGAGNTRVMGDASGNELSTSAKIMGNSGQFRGGPLINNSIPRGHSSNSK